jgi:predicted transcriptional regulator
MEIMNVVWERGGEAKVVEVWRALSARRKVSRTTVLTMLSRLAEKGWLFCTKDERAHRYHAARSREATVRLMVRRMIDIAFGGSAEGLVMTLLDDRRLSKEEVRNIKGMLDRVKVRA